MVTLERLYKGGYVLKLVMNLVKSAQNAKLAYDYTQICMDDASSHFFQPKLS